MRKRLVATLVLVLGLVGWAPVPATAKAAADGVHIRPVAGATVDWGKRAVVKPSAVRKGRAVIDSVRLTVKQGSRTVVRSRQSASLPAGRYRATTTVKYRTYSWVPRTQVVRAAGSKVAAGDYLIGCRMANLGEDRSTGTLNCRVDHWDFDARFTFSTPFRVTVDKHDWITITSPSGAFAPTEVFSLSAAEDVEPDWVKLPRTWKRVESVRKYSRTRTSERSQALVIKQRPKPRGCATYGDFLRVSADFSEPETYGDSKAEVARLLQSGGWRTSYSDYGDHQIEFRDYKACASGASIYVGFSNGRAYSKMYRA